ncbi:MAG: two-component system response regulator [Aliivibrio sp.]|uniref:HD-GYP domain-containing protein n=1 Tax=Aliivibrio sp. TaxID=1872443 RepID=UPI001A4F40D8|nr:two-component system response regulator [Aliivibrio sp.]
MTQIEKKILAVDDTAENLDVLKEMLSEQYTLLLTTKPQLAVTIAQSQQPDLVLLDIMMPEIDGYQVCELLKNNPKTAHIPIIFLTAKAEIDDEAKGLILGAVDYITKPVCAPILHARIETHIMLKKAQDALKQQNTILEQKIVERTREIDAVRDVTMIAMGTLAESRDSDTGAHIRRTQNYVKLLANKLVDNDRFHAYLTPEIIQILFKSAPLHDIGKVGIPDKILLKPGKLTADEFEIMKTHSIIGRDAIALAEQLLKKQNIKHTFLTIAEEIAGGHQEKWDGSGYPDGLKGDDIPISARIMAIADVYDALNCRRVYKDAFSHDKVISIMTEGRGRHFDPDMLDTFIENIDEFRSIAIKFSD